MSSWPAPTQAPRWTPSGVPASRNVQLRRWPGAMSKEPGLDLSRSSGNPNVAAAFGRRSRTVSRQPCGSPRARAPANLGAVQLHRIRPVEDPVQAVTQAGAACPDDDDPKRSKSRTSASRCRSSWPGGWLDTSSSRSVDRLRVLRGSPPDRGRRIAVTVASTRRAAAEITGREKARVAGAWVDPRPRFAARGTPCHRATIRTSTQRSRSPGASSDRPRSRPACWHLPTKGAWA